MSKYDVAAFVWPSYTRDEPRATIFWEKGFGEWQTVINAKKRDPREPDCRQPLWGYVNESNPDVMEMEINVAKKYGVNTFIYDWYWYDRTPFLECCLDGFLKASNCNDMKFYLMWANHNVGYLWDTRVFNGFNEGVIWKGTCERAEYEKICKRIIEKYFSKPNYYQIDGCPVFMIYHLPLFVEAMGSIDKANDAINFLRNECVKAGFKGLHFQAAYPYRQEVTINVDGGEWKGLTTDLVELLDFDSVTFYNYGATAKNLNQEYPKVLEESIESWDRISGELKIPMFPNVAMGWDTNARFKEGEFQDMITTETTPDNIEKAFVAAKEFVDKKGLDPKLITVNSWNEWTEASYLQPDTINGYGYLERLKKVFG